MLTYVNQRNRQISKWWNDQKYILRVGNVVLKFTRLNDSL